jgi:hypothetical protein
MCRRRSRYALSWLAVTVAGGVSLVLAWNQFNNRRRHDGNEGHVTIDFGGQYLMGRMLLKGNIHHLYHRNYQRKVLREIFPTEDEDPGQSKSDVEQMMEWVMGNDDPQAAATIGSFTAPLSGGPLNSVASLAMAHEFWTESRLAAIDAPQVGGPLYPPINAFLYYPLALLPPRTAYRLAQTLCLFLALTAGLAISVLSERRVWWPIAAFCIMLYPGFPGCINLGQNAILTLNILLWGYVLVAMNRPVLGGMVWGCLAYKPVWALAFFLFPVLSRRWRMAASMAVTGTVLAAMTLPAVGVEGWRNWLQVGSEATLTYLVDQNWIELARDVLTIPQRWLDFSIPLEKRLPNQVLILIGWVMLLAIFEITVRWSLARRDRVRETTGPGPAFLLLGAWLCSYHFMYYDVLLTVLPLTLLFVEPARFLEPLLVAFIPLTGVGVREKLATYYDTQMDGTAPSPVPSLSLGHGTVWVCNRVEPTIYVLLVATLFVFPVIGLGMRRFSFDTTFLSALWAWCGWLLFWQARKEKVEQDARAPALQSSDGSAVTAQTAVL